MELKITLVQITVQSISKRLGNHNTMSDGTIYDLLERKGTVQIIVEIGFGSKTFDQIEEPVLVSSSTVSNRLKEGVDTDLFDVTYRTTDHGTQKRYELTRTGKTIMNLIQELDIDSTVRKYQRVTRRFDQKTDNLIDHATRHIQIVPDKLPPGKDVTSDLPPPEQIPEESLLGDVDMDEKRRKKLEKNLVGGLEYNDEDRADDDQSEDEQENQDS